MVDRGMIQCAHMSIPRKFYVVGPKDKEPKSLTLPNRHELIDYLNISTQATIVVMLPGSAGISLAVSRDTNGEYYVGAPNLEDVNVEYAAVLQALLRGVPVAELNY